MRLGAKRTLEPFEQPRRDIHLGTAVDTTGVVMGLPGVNPLVGIAPAPTIETSNDLMLGHGVECAVDRGQRHGPGGFGLHMSLGFLCGAMGCRVAERLTDSEALLGQSEPDLAQSQFNGYPERHAVPRSRVEGSVAER